MPLKDHLHGRRASLGSARSSAEEARTDSPGAGEDETIVEPEQNNVLSHIIAQLRPGADLSRITLPTFILEPRSMLERITNFMAHPETLLPMPEVEDPVQRFVSVVKFYLSGWHIKPPGVKKPLNPILGEIFTCYWEYPDKTRGYYISEQTSHHPPKSSYFFCAPEHHIRVDGTLKPRSKFLGNSAASLMEGISYLRFTNRGKTPGGEKYVLTQPNMYARGILFGKMKYELGDHSFVRCPENGLVADLEFKTKGYFSGTYNAIGGTIKNEKTSQVLYELTGMWNGEMYIKDVSSGRKELLFNATNAKHTSPLARPLEEQGERESQRLWQTTAEAVIARDHERATDEKSKIEDRQRQENQERADRGIEWQPKLFRKVKAGPGGSEEGEEDLEFILNAKIDGKTPEEITKQILAIVPILPGQKHSQAGGTPEQNALQSGPAGPVPPRKYAVNNTAAGKGGPAADNPNLIDFNEPAPAASNPGSSGPVDHLSDQMAGTNLMEPMKPTASTPQAPAAAANGSDARGNPIKRIDSSTGEGDAFFDAAP